MKPLIAAIAGKPFVVTGIRPGEFCRMEYERAKSGWILHVEYVALHGRVARFRVKTRSKPTDGQMQGLCNRIEAAQTRAAQKAASRQPQRPMPPAIARAAYREIFPSGEMTETEWLAHVCRECGPKGEAFAEQRLKQWCAPGQWHRLLQFFAEQRAAKESDPSTTKKALNLFLFAYWPQLSQPNMTRAKAHELATRTIGQNRAGSLSAFQKYCDRNGICFARVGAPNK